MKISIKRLLISPIFFFFFLFLGKGFASTCTPQPSISGPDSVTRPGSYQYTLSNAQGDVRWCVTGVGVKVDIIDSSLVVTLDNTACGSFTVSATDSSCTATKDVMGTDSGQWVLIESAGSYDGCLIKESISGICRYLDDWCGWVNNPSECAGTCTAGPFTPHTSFGSPSYDNSACGAPPEQLKECPRNLEGYRKYEWRCGGDKEVETACAGGCEDKEEVCGDGIDNNCDGVIDEGCAKILQYVSGSGQVGDICETIKSPFMVLVSNATSLDSAHIGWQVTDEPQGAAGAGIAQSMTTFTGTEIQSEAYLRLGSLPGDYLTEAICAECTSGSPQTFTAMAKCPNVPKYRQGDDEWADEPYDSICKDYEHLTPSGRPGTKPCASLDDEPWTIRGKGCALTSLAMVAGRYNSTAKPDEWNRFLYQSDKGYSRDGNVDWKALTNTDLQLKTALYDKSQIPLSNTKMDTYLAKCMPVIVKVINPNTNSWHWVTVTQKLGGGDYMIQDPGYKDRLLLSAYSNKIYALQVYEKNNGGCQ